MSLPYMQCVVTFCLPIWMKAASMANTKRNPGPRPHYPTLRGGGQIHSVEQKFVAVAKLGAKLWPAAKQDNAALSVGRFDEGGVPGQFFTALQPAGKQQLSRRIVENRAALKGRPGRPAKNRAFEKENCFLLARAPRQWMRNLRLYT